jgi:hypothetical protein
MAESNKSTKKEYPLISRLSHAEKQLDGAKTPTERAVAQARIDNIVRMMQDDFDYGKFSKGGKAKKKTTKKKTPTVKAHRGRKASYNEG